MFKLLVTGSSGLISSEVCLHFASLGWEIYSADNNQRAVFFGSQGDTRWNQQRLQSLIKGFVHHEVDIRDRNNVLDLIDSIRPDAIAHTAAQPSHDLAAKIPFDDFDPNAVGTLNLNTCSILEAFDIVASFTGRQMQYEYLEQNREGDHTCYYNELRKMRLHYPQWSIIKSLTDIFKEITESWQVRLT